jgi:hypothetical protein
MESTVLLSLIERVKLRGILLPPVTCLENWLVGELLATHSLGCHVSEMPTLRQCAQFSLSELAMATSEPSEHGFGHTSEFV